MGMTMALFCETTTSIAHGGFQSRENPKFGALAQEGRKKKKRGTREKKREKNATAHNCFAHFLFHGSCGAF